MKSDELKRVLNQLDKARIAVNDTESLQGELYDTDECGFYVGEMKLRVGKKTMHYLMNERIKILKKYQNELQKFIKQKQ